MNLKKFFYLTSILLHSVLFTDVLAMTMSREINFLTNQILPGGCRVKDLADKQKNKIVDFFGEFSENLVHPTLDTSAAPAPQSFINWDMGKRWVSQTVSGLVPGFSSLPAVSSVLPHWIANYIAYKNRSHAWINGEIQASINREKALEREITNGKNPWLTQFCYNFKSDAHKVVYSGLGFTSLVLAHNYAQKNPNLASNVNKIEYPVIRSALQAISAFDRTVSSYTLADLLPLVRQTITLTPELKEALSSACEHGNLDEPIIQGLNIVLAGSTTFPCAFKNFLEEAIAEKLKDPTLSSDIRNILTETLSVCAKFPTPFATKVNLKDVLTLGGQITDAAKIAFMFYLGTRCIYNIHRTWWSNHWSRFKSKATDALYSSLTANPMLLGVGGTAVSLYWLANHYEMSFKQIKDCALDPKTTANTLTTAAGIIFSISIQGTNWFKNLFIGQPETNTHPIFKESIDTKLTLGKFAPGSLIKEFLQIKSMVNYPAFWADTYDLLKNTTDEGGLRYILTGPPGTGKTFLAQQLAQELGGAFFELNPATLNTGTVGQGQEILRKCFTEVAKVAANGSPVVLFMDELDSLGKRHSAGENSHGVTEENNKILNYFLTLLTKCGSKVIIIGATNNVDLIDSAVLRDGRMGRQIKIELPDFQERKLLFAHYLNEKRKRRSLAADVDDELANEIAKSTEGMSKGYFMDLVTDAAIESTGSPQITAAHIRTTHRNKMATKKAINQKPKKPNYRNSDDPHDNTLFEKDNVMKTIEGMYNDINQLKQLINPHNS